MFRLFSLLFLSLSLFFVPTAFAQESPGIVSCIVPNGKISTHSVKEDPVGGHCGTSYGYSCACDNDGRRAKAIDVLTNGQAVVLPLINGNRVNWKLIVKGYPIDGGEGGGLGYTFEAKVSSDTWYLDILHLNSTTIGEGETVPSGTPVATSAIRHVHATIGKNLKASPRAGSATDCDSGWLASDFMCDATKQMPETPQDQTGKIQASMLQCTFQRGDLANPKESFKSPQLLGYFIEASKASGVPAEVLAGIARVESPSSVNLTDETLSSFSCPTSPTGARGLMQIQPPGTTGHDPAAVANGARLLGKEVSQLTATDFCDLRTSVFMAAGFILKKLQYLGHGDGQSWNPEWTNNQQIIYSVARSYYGCLLYPSCSSGPHSYGEDVWQSVQGCKNPSLTGGPVASGPSGIARSNKVCTKVGNPTTPNPCASSPGGGIVPGTPAPPVEPGQHKLKIKELFNVDMQGAWDETHLKWVYEKFYELGQSTNFVKLVGGEPVTLCNCVPNQMTGTVQMSQSGIYATDRDLFLGTLIHELGHAIYHHKPAGTTFIMEHNNLYASNGTISSYSRAGFDKTENYPEMLAYCLNGRAVGTINKEKWPPYKDIATKIMGSCFY
jgi:hypothetical protein